MSMEALAWAMKQPVSPPTRKLLLVTLADKANAAAECWPSLAMLCEATGLSERQARRQVTALVADGLLVTENRGRSTNLYRLILTGHAVPVKDTDNRTPVTGLDGHECPVKEIANRTLVTEVQTTLTGHQRQLNRTPVTVTSLLTQKNPKEKLPRTRGHAHTREGPKAPAKHPEVAAMAKAYETLSLSINPRIGELMVEWCKEHPKTPVEWFAQAADEALKANVRSWNYFVKVLDSWSAQGFAGRRDARADRPGYGRIPRTPGDLSFAANA